MTHRRRRDRSYRDAQDEIEFYLERRADELRRQGMSEVEARRAARQAFGDPDQIAWEVVTVDERTRARRSAREMLASYGHDLRYAGRFLANNALFAAVAVGTLALGIGATTAIFSLLEAALLRRPAVQNPQSLVAVYTTCRLGAPRCSTSWPDYVDYRDRTEGLADLAVQSSATTMLGDEDGRSRPVVAEGVTGNFFPLLGVDPAEGRLLQPDDDRFGAGEYVVALSHDLWRDAFASDPDVVGRTVRLNGSAFEVVGVADPEFDGLALGESADLWVPMQSFAAVNVGLPRDGSVWEMRDGRWMGRLVGRLGPEVTLDQARSELMALSDRMREENPQARGPRSVTVDPLGRYLAPASAVDDLPRFIWLLMGVVGATLLLACANLANLQLARGSTRSGEIGVRIAIGAGRGRLIRQLLAESLILSGLGTLVGLVVAGSMLRLLAGFELPGGIPIGSLEAGIDTRLLSVAALLAAVTAVLCGLVPALQATRPGVADTLRVGHSPGGRRRGGRVRGALVALQVGLCVILLVGSGLFVRTLRGALGADLGFRTEGLSLARFNLSLVGYDGTQAFSLVEALRERVAARPGVRSVALASVVPIDGGARRGTFATVEGYQPAPDEEMRIDRVLVTPGYFETLGIPMLAGRDFGAADLTGDAAVAIVSREMAEKYWPEGRAVGGAFGMLGRGTFTVVGVADDVNWQDVEEAHTNFAFFPMTPSADGIASYLTVVARSDDADALVPALGDEIRAVEPDLPVASATTMDAALGELLMPQRMGTALLSGFAVLALILAAVGIAGVVSYTVGEERRSIGVRIALGARRGQVVRSVVLRMAIPILGGLGVGIGAAALLDDVLESFLYGVVPGDPATYAVIAVGLALIAFAATVLPARAATRVDPLTVLRAE